MIVHGADVPQSAAALLIQACGFAPAHPAVLAASTQRMLSKFLQITGAANIACCP
jgi:hypothetical protein